MESYISHIDLSVLIFATVAGLAAGLVKGVVGFGMPMIFCRVWQCSFRSTVHLQH